MAVFEQLPAGALVVRSGAAGRPYWEAKWRFDGRQRLRRVGPAWLDPDGAGGWKPRRGRAQPGFLDEKRAIVRMAEMITADVDGTAAAAERAAAAAAVTFREVARDWVRWQKEVKGARPSTLRDLQSVLAEPGTHHARGRRVCAGRIMGALGDRPAGEITIRDVSAFLGELDHQGLTARNVNKHRQVLSAIFNYAMRADTFELAANPAEATDKRREPPPSALDFYEPAEVEAIAEAAATARHRRSLNGRGERPMQLTPDELAWREIDDRQDAELLRVLAYTGVRIGEAITLRWGDVDLANRRLIVQRALSGTEEGPTKGWQVRYVPLADPAAAALRRMRARVDFTAREDYVFCNRVGQRLDPSALRRRYTAAVDHAGLRRIKLHGLRHGAGSLVARETDAVFVQHFLGHAKLSTTERYMHAKARAADVARLNAAFAVDSSAAA